MELHVHFPIVQAMFCSDVDIGVGLCFERKQEIAYKTASFSWHLLAIEQCREKRDQNISLGTTLAEVNYVLKFCSK